MGVSPKRGAKRAALHYLINNPRMQYTTRDIAAVTGFTEGALNGALAALVLQKDITRVRPGWYTYDPGANGQAPTKEPSTGTLFEFVGNVNEEGTVRVLKDESGGIWRAERLS